MEMHQVHDRIVQRPVFCHRHYSVLMGFSDSKYTVHIVYRHSTWIYHHCNMIWPLHNTLLNNLTSAHTFVHQDTIHMWIELRHPSIFHYHLAARYLVVNHYHLSSPLNDLSTANQNKKYCWTLNKLNHFTRLC